MSNIGRYSKVILDSGVYFMYTTYCCNLYLCSLLASIAITPFAFVLYEKEGVATHSHRVSSREHLQFRRVRIVV